MMCMIICSQSIILICIEALVFIFHNGFEHVGHSAFYLGIYLFRVLNPCFYMDKYGMYVLASIIIYS